MFETFLDFLRCEIVAAPWWLLLLCYISVGFLQCSFMKKVELDDTDGVISVLLGGLLWPIGTAILLLFGVFFLLTRLYEFMFGDTK